MPSKGKAEPGNSGKLVKEALSIIPLFETGSFYRWHRALEDARDLLEWPDELFDLADPADYDFTSETPEMTAHRKVIWQALTKTLVNHEDIMMVYLRNKKRDVRAAYRAVLGEFNRQTPSNTASMINELMNLKMEMVDPPLLRTFAAEIQKLAASILEQSGQTVASVLLFTIFMKASRCRSISLSKHTAH